MRHCFNVLAGKVPIFQHGPSPGLREGQGGTPGKSWWGYAARSSKSGPYFRPKNVIFLTRFQTWPLKSLPFFRPGVSHKTQHTCLHRTEIMSSLVRFECQQKDFLKSTSFRVPKGLMAPGLQDSNFIIIIIIIQIQILVNPELFISQ